MSKPVILVIDDDVPILTLMRNVLREFGFEARVASSGRAAITTAGERSPDLILLDKNIPGSSVSETIQSLRGDGGLSAPIVILSGEPVEADELRTLGAAGAVMKPFDVMELVERIRGYVGVAR
ncbi:MAG TPA: response regulator [Thermoanaerobaculia bacterium]|jgi:DNA-binding response OmpR family regulator